MATLFDFCSEESRNKLLNIAKRITEDNNQKKIELENERKKEYNRTHIFKSYEDALDFMETYPGVEVEWHTSIISYDKETGMFMCQEQIPVDDIGARFYYHNVFRTRDEIMKIHYDSIKLIQQRYPGSDEGNLYDENGKLRFVNLF